MTSVQYLIVGQGLAGTVLAQTFLKHNRSILIIDDPSLSNASKIAAGLYNPIVFKRLAKSWKIDELLPVMDAFYNETEKLLEKKFYFKKTIVKLFTEEQEKILWLKKTKEDAGKYLSEKTDEDSLRDIVYNSIGASEVNHAGNLNIGLFLNSFKEYFSQKGILLEEKFDYQQLAITAKNILYKNITADKVIFCEGYKAAENPYFSWLPFKLTKGQVITIYCPALKKTEKVINKGVFILPIGADLYKVGATYEWNYLSDKPTKEGKTELMDKLKKVLRVNFEVVDHQAGIRPTVIQRRPLLGLHPQYPVFGVFNGLGTKGVMLAPYFAKQLYDFLETGKPLDEEVDVKNYFKAN